MSKTRAKSKSKATHQGLPVSHSHINSKKCLTHEGASNQPTYATDINIIKEIKGDVKNQVKSSVAQRSEHLI